MSKRCKDSSPISLPELKLTLVPLFLAFLILLCGCGKSVLEQKAEALKKGLPDETSTNVRLYAYKENRIDYILTADYIERFYDRKLLWAYGTKITSYDEKMQIRSTMTADTTFVDEARNLIQAIGNVHLSSANGQIKTRRLMWDRNVDELIAPEKVVLLRNSDVLRGENLRTDIEISFAEMNTVSAEGIIRRDEIDW